MTKRLGKIGFISYWLFNIYELMVIKPARAQNWGQE